MIRPPVDRMFDARRPSRRSAGCRLCAVLPLILCAAASAAEVELSIPSAQAYVDESLTLQIVVRDFSSCEKPILPEIPGCRVRLSGGPFDASQVSIINNKISKAVTRTYEIEIVPSAAGEIEIPPIPIRVDGRTLETRPVRVRVERGNVDELLAVEITSDRSRLYVGERVELTLRIWVRPAMYERSSLDEHQMRNFFTRLSLGVFPADSLKINRRRIKDANGDRQLYYTYELSTMYVAERPGRLVFDDIEVQMRYPTRIERDFLDLRVASHRNLVARPKVADVEVVPLPVDGRPANFNGAVGHYNIAVRANPTSVHVGDPIELIIELWGEGPVETLPPPLMADDPRFVGKFRIAREQLAGEMRGGRKRYVQVIRAASPDVAEIPPIEYPYFDPQREQYVTTISEPIRLQVEPVEQLDVADLATLVPRVDAEAPANLTALDGLRGNVSREDLLLATAPGVTLAGAALGAAAPPVAYAVCWAWSRFSRRSSGDSARRRKSAARNALARLETARRLAPRERAAEAAATLAGYVADRLGEPPARFIGAALPEFLRGRSVPEDVVKMWSDVLERCEAASFGAGPAGDDPALLNQAEASIFAMERERL